MGVRRWTIDVHPAGILPVPGWECFFGNNATEFYDLVFYVWVLSSAGQLGIVDTGLPLAASDRSSLDEACQGVDPRCKFRNVVGLDKILKAAGIEPADIDFVLLTQTVTYSTGGLIQELTPEADVYLARPGLDELLYDRPGHPPPDFYFTADSWAYLRTLLLEDRLHAVDGRTEVCDGIVFEATGGHHPGSGGVLVQTDAGGVGILETAFLQRNIEEVLPVGIAEDAAQARRVIRRYRDQADQVLAAHDPGVVDTLHRFGVRQRSARTTD